MNIIKMTKIFGIGAIGFSAGVVATCYGVGKLIKHSNVIQNGISLELEKLIRHRLRKILHLDPDCNIKYDDSYESVIFDTRTDAESVLKEMQRLIHDYGMATISDFLDLSGCCPTYRENLYGWRKMSAWVVRVKGGYKILFEEKPERIKL